MQTTFKAGDLVYYPNHGTEIYKLQESNRLDFPLEIKNGSTWTIFRSNGKANSLSDMTQIFHATEDNCHLLSRLYGVEFEKPRPTPAAIVKKMLNDGYTYVICNILLPKGVVKDIVRDYDDNLFFGEYGNYDYDQVIPLGSYTGKVIVDYIDGKPVLEDE